MEYLYVCHFSNGHIKVGRSIAPQSRIAAHADRVACLGVELVEHAVFQCIGLSIPAEAQLIRQCREAASANHKTEWFVGLDFEIVCEWAAELSTSELSATYQYTKCQFTPKQRAEIAAQVGIGEPYLYQCLTGRRDMNPAEAYRIERESKGLATRQMLCQKTWRGIWPELSKSKPTAKQEA